jgi:DnaK suppressor protein
VKAKPGKVTVSSKAKTAAGKAAPAAKKVTAKAAAPAKASAKAAPAKKAASPSVAKKAAAPVKKAAAKPVVKVAPKVAAKPTAKAAPKAAPKAAAKTAPKTPQKTTPKTAPAGTAKAPAKVAVKPAAKAIAKPAAKPEPKAAPKAAAPVAPKVPAKAVPVAGAKLVAVPASHEVLRSPKPSARLAQVTVPSMAQATASTAAKASFVPTMSQTLIAPPLPSSIKKDPKLANNWKSKSAEELSDEELMAMPDGEYMNDKQMAAFRVRLQRLKQDILNNAGETTEHLREETVIVPDPADRATIEEEHALELRTRDRERKLLKKIEQSIGRIDAGDYGYCDETGEPIGVGRLLARPTATLSLEAQQRRELKQKMFGD